MPSTRPSSPPPPPIRHRAFRPSVIARSTAALAVVVALVTMSWAGPGAADIGGATAPDVRSTGAVLVASVGPASVGASSESARADGRWEWPVAAPQTIVRPFDPPRHRYGAGHRGFDVGAEAGATVTSPAPGVVIFAGPVGGRSVVTVDHGDGIVSTVDPVEPAVSRGGVVAAGTVLGRLGPASAMHCEDGCLHLGVRSSGEYVDPRPFFARPERAVLLPHGD